MRLVLRLTLIMVILAVGGAALYLFWLQRSYLGEAENYSQIEDGLYMGGDVEKPPRGTKAVLNLCEKEDGYRCESYRWEPIADTEPAPSIDWLRHMVEFIADNRQAGRTTFVHCRNGVSRSGLVVTAYLMQKNHWPRDEALAFIRTKRPEARPNPAFMKLLLDWQSELGIGP
jgi:hypothetical protein